MIIATATYCLFSKQYPERPRHRGVVCRREEIKHRLHEQFAQLQHAKLERRHGSKLNDFGTS